MSALDYFCPKCHAIPGERCVEIFLILWMKIDTPHPERKAPAKRRGGFWGLFFE